MILVTGGLGFLGSHIALSLMAEGKEVVLVDNLSNSNIQTLKRLELITQKYITFLKLDIRNTPALIRVFAEYPITSVIHAAGFKSIEESTIRPLEYYNANVSCIMSLLRAMQQTGVRTLVCLSSLQVYAQSSLDLKEETEINFGYDNPYIKSQQMVEQIIQDTFRVDHEWKISILRIANVTGAFKHFILGENIPPFPKNIVPLLLQVAAGCRENIELRRNHATPDKTAQRSFVHVLDICSAIQQSLKRLHEQPHVLDVFNLGGTIVSMVELIEIVENITEKKIDIGSYQYDNFCELAQVGTQSLKAKEILDWEAKRNIQQMIQDQWWFYNQVLLGQ